MEQVVGTLVKYGRSGSYEPYLAKTWTTSSNELEWRFQLRDNLSAENGQDIDAHKFVHSLKNILRYYASMGTPPMFSDLVGWSEFQKGNDSSLQIKAEDRSTVLFRFARRPSGVLEFLAMPYFGFYDSNDLMADTESKITSITSSGAYRVLKISGKQAILALREGLSFIDTSEAPKIVNIFSKPLEEISTSDAPAIIQLKKNEHRNSNYLESSYRIDTVPTILTSLILSPFVAPFDDINTRKSFRSLVRRILDGIDDSTLNEKTSSHFYPLFNNFPLEKEENLSTDASLSKLRGKTFNLFTKNSSLIQEDSALGIVLARLKNEYDIHIKIINPDMAGADWLKEVNSNERYAIRLTSVDIGGAPEDWLIQMMFAGRLGVSFPDKDNRMKSVIEKYRDNKYESTNHYWQHIHNAIEEDSTVVVLSHWGGSWLITNDIPQTNFKQTMNMPRFDLIKMGR